MVGISQKNHLESKKSEKEEKRQGSEKEHSLTKKKARGESNKSCASYNSIDFKNRWWSRPNISGPQLRNINHSM